MYSQYLASSTRDTIAIVQQRLGRLPLIFNSISRIFKKTSKVVAVDYVDYIDIEHYQYPLVKLETDQDFAFRILKELRVSKMN